MIPRTATDDSEDSRDVLRLSDPKHLLELLHDKFGQRAAAPDAAAPSSHDAPRGVSVFYVEPTRVDNRVWSCFDNFLPSTQSGEPARGSPPRPSRTKWTRRVSHPVLIGHAVHPAPTMRESALNNPATRDDPRPGRASPPQPERAHPHAPQAKAPSDRRAQVPSRRLRGATSGDAARVRAPRRALAHRCGAARAARAGRGASAARGRRGAGVERRSWRRGW
jgi:hypothetical protein